VRKVCTLTGEFLYPKPTGFRPQRLRRRKHHQRNKLKTMKQKILTAVSAVLVCVGAHAQSFTDNFNRPDSLTAGNGWLDATDNPLGAHLGIVAGRLTPTSANVAAVYRPFPSAAPVVLSAVITDENGYYCGDFRKRYALSFAIRNDGTMGGGYRVNFSRADQTYDSFVSISDNGVPIATVQSSFQFGFALTIIEFRINNGYGFSHSKPIRA
jgi:hypothetical protein